MKKETALEELGYIQKETLSRLYESFKLEYTGYRQIDIYFNGHIGIFQNGSLTMIKPCEIHALHQKLLELGL